VGQITKKQLADKKDFKGIKQGTEIGQNGLEAAYDKYLRGTDGSYRIEVNAAGERRQAFTAKKPTPGRTLKLTLHQELQHTGEQAIRNIGGGRPGAFVAMNPQTGAIYAMGSLPTYDPRDAAPGRFSTTAAYDAHFGEEAGAPLINRADESAYPTGSTFKPITALAALSSGVVTPGEIFNDEGCFQTGARKNVDVACNAGHEVNGPVNLVSALKVSSDVYFYRLGKLMYEKLPAQPLQRWAYAMGMGRRTGIDVPGEHKGTIPSPQWVRDLVKAELKCRKKKKDHSPCGIADPTASWNPGDNENFAVGQGALQATPLQMAVAYSTIINSGRVPRPFLAQQIQDTNNGRIERIDPPSARKVDGIKPQWRQAIMDGLYAAANDPKGTSKQVFDNGWPRSRYPIFGKTGTAERFYGPAQAEIDQSWYVAYSYDRNPNNRPIIVVATIEKSGFGAEFAAPAARLILSNWFHVKPKVVKGDSRTR
jgi:penicillin-binding protein 2